METDQLRGLSTVRINKDFLLKKLETNRKSHETIYKKAMQKWHLQVIDTLKKELKKVKVDKEHQPSCFVAKPDSHVKEYDGTIALLKASLDEEFVLTSFEFSQYVRDEWGWKDVFMTTVSGCLNYKEN